MQETKRITIRPAEPGDIDALMHVFDLARNFMRSSGNFSQWTGGYHSEELVRSEISSSHCHVCLAEAGTVVGTFCFSVGEDPTYRTIDGAWKAPGPYGTIHRLASSGAVPGIADACFGWCWEQIRNLRADTHEDNAMMIRKLEAAGFDRCGIIHLRDGSPRIAYQKTCSCY